MSDENVMHDWSTADLRMIETELEEYKLKQEKQIFQLVYIWLHGARSCDGVLLWADFFKANNFENQSFTPSNLIEQVTLINNRTND